ncbi:MAG: DUF2551 domain-containing protein [Methanomicrobiaceae archaeon]|nr:DUF2551 domain-containing protein [Methanomicrobiaceae archaeon]
MRSPADLRKEIESRLRSYLSRDKTGIRHEILNIFVKIKSLTIADVHDFLQQRFEITYQSVASMVGIIASKIGILRVIRTTDTTNTTYELRDQYRDLVVRVIGSC